MQEQWDSEPGWVLVWMSGESSHAGVGTGWTGM